MKKLYILIFLLTALGWNNSNAQCVSGCNDNTFVRSHDPNTIEYDNIVSTFHASMVREADGRVMVWGQGISATAANVLSPQEVSVDNGYNFTGSILRFTGASSATSQQFALLTTTGLYVWGTRTNLVANGNLVNANNSFQKMTVDGKADGLPVGVIPSDVKMLFGTYRTLVVVTCTGDAWVLSSTGAKNGDGSTDNNGTKWTRVKKDATTNLTGVVAVRGINNGLVALTSNGELYTWGTGVYLGDGNAAVNSSYAKKMIVPAGVQPKMIGMTVANAYYLLARDGRLFSLGGNTRRQLGIYSDVASLSWAQPRKNSSTGPVFDDVAWISPQEHENGATYAAINILTKAGKLYAWGSNDGNMIGGTSNGTNYDPLLMPGGLDANDVLMAVETGGHTTVAIKQCSKKYGYVGHKTAGSMGDGSGDSGNPNTFSFATSELTVCGAPAAPPVQNIKICPNTTGDLGTAHLAAVPDGVALEWWTTANRVTGTKVSNPGAVGVGTYYAFYIPNTGNCENPPASQAVKVTINDMCPTDLDIRKSINNNYPREGETVTFTITLKNLGPYDATNVEATEALPSGYQFVIAVPSQGTFNSGTGKWSVGSVANQATVTLTVQAKVLATGLYDNTVTVKADQADPVPANNTFVVPVTLCKSGSGQVQLSGNVLKN